MIEGQIDSQSDRLHTAHAYIHMYIHIYMHTYILTSGVQHICVFVAEQLLDPLYVS